MIQKILTILFPSFNNDIFLLAKSLAWGIRLYYLYSFFVFEFIRWFLGDESFSFSWPLWIFAIQAAFLLYVFQSYRKFFVLLGAYEKRYFFGAIVALWLISFLLYNILQIILSPFFIANQMFPASLLWHFVPILLAGLGEYILRKLKPQEAVKEE